MVTESKAEEGSYLPFLNILAFFGNKWAILQLFTGVTDGHSGHRWSQMVTGGHSWSQNRRGLGVPVDGTPFCVRVFETVVLVGLWSHLGRRSVHEDERLGHRWRCAHPRARQLGCLPASHRSRHLTAAFLQPHDIVRLQTAGRRGNASAFAHTPRPSRFVGVGATAGAFT